MASFLDWKMGTGAGNDDGDLVYSAITAIRTNLINPFADVAAAGNIKLQDQPISILGIDTATYDTEFKQVARAINIKDPGFVVPIGYMAVVSYIKAYEPNSDSTLFRRRSFAISRGAGGYGLNNPAGTEEVSVDPGGLVPLGETIVPAESTWSLGEIGTQDIQAAVNGSSTELVKSGFTVANALRSGVKHQYIVDATDQSYGASWASTAAHNFIDANESADLVKTADERSVVPDSQSSDLTIDETSLFKTVKLTQNTATATIEDDATDKLNSGVYGQVSFSGTGPHTFNYPTTDGVGKLILPKGSMVYYEKRAADEWIVKPLGGFDVLSQEIVVTVSLTQAQIKAGNTTPVEVTELGLPGDGYRWKVSDADASLDHNGTDYGGTPELRIKTDTASDPQFTIDSSFLTASADTFTRMQANIDGDVSQYVENKKLFIETSEDRTENGGTVKVILTAKRLPI